MVKKGFDKNWLVFKLKIDQKRFYVIGKIVSSFSAEKDGQKRVS